MYEWDELKCKQNLLKHGLSFEDADLIFSGFCITFEDKRYDYGEERFITLGMLADRTVVIAHTPRGDKARFISMRKANIRETKIYQKRLETH